MAGIRRKITPMMEQYLEIRDKLPPNTLLLFRLGDFYEMFDEDAAKGAEVLGITLTKRNGQPMAGIPYHAADTYIQKILRRGMKVAICEQMESPKPGQLVKRSLTRILSPATTLEDQQIDSDGHRFLLACNTVKAQTVAAWLDLTTGDFQISAPGDSEALLNIFNAIQPKELLLPEHALSKWRDSDDFLHLAEGLERLSAEVSVSELPDWDFDQIAGAKSVMEILGVLNLEGFGFPDTHPSLGCAGALLQYAADHLCSPPQNISRIQEFSANEHLQMDPATLRNLEIFKSSSGSRKGSLLHAMDESVTAAGSRLLETYLAEPPLSLKELRRRQDCVGEFLQAPTLASELQEYLKGVRDIPRILGRLRNRISNPREAGAVRDTLNLLPHILSVLSQFDSLNLGKLASKIHSFEDLSNLLNSSLSEELPANLQDGGIINAEYNPELDEIRELSTHSKKWLTKFESQESLRTGIKNLRVKFNNAFGYFIEVTKSNLGNVPDDYIRKQTMTNAERFYTPELKEKEKEILGAEEKAISLEEELFKEVVSSILAEADSLEETALTLAEIDLFAGWAQLARKWDYCCPSLDESDAIEIKAGRHPVVEQMMHEQRIKGLPGEHDFVPNDTMLIASSEQIAVLTGPNMAGKSTFIRQVALIVLMAQVGSWVPAKSCRIGLVDRIFSRVGASDELSRGNSTFMVEMNETANILNNATAKSLIILDEIGRGTSTYDGLSIAWAVVEHLHGKDQAGPKTLFATHYHELTQIARSLKRVRNYSVAVKEWNDTIIFVRQVLKGAADRSYGIQVARLAGLPDSVIKRATVILGKLESDDSSHNLLRKSLKKGQKAGESNEPQLELF